MPRKIRQLKSDLKKAGFIELADRGKGSHARWQHPERAEAFATLSGKNGDDAQPYQEKHVRQEIAKVLQEDRSPG